MRLFCVISVAVSLVVFVPIVQASSPVPESKAVGTIAKPLSPSLVKEALHAMDIGIQWLESNQQDNGCWSSPMFPGMTALVASAIMRSNSVANEETQPQSVEQAIAFITSSMQDSGCIFQDIQGPKGGGMPNYNTSLSIMALADTGDPKYALIIDRARECLISGQYNGPGIFNGGMGYDADKDRPYADLSNTMMALEALRRTEPVEQGDSQAPGLNWEASIKFLSRCQHLRESNDLDWVSDSVEEQGGFIYHPEESKAGAELSEEGISILRSYGSMTYAGLLSFLYAKVDRQDPRVQAARRWISLHWNLEENPGMGKQGLYYNYHTLAKALSAYGEDTLELPGGKRLCWRPALIEKLVSLQRVDPKTGLGYWVNDNNRWWENDPNLVTAYTLLALAATLDGAVIPE